MDGKLLELEDAQELLLNIATPINQFEVIKLEESINRISANEYYADLDQPPFDRSPLDGYALNHEDTVGANKENPATLLISQEVFAGDIKVQKLLKGTATRIFTGAPMPEGATCVIRQEDISIQDGKLLVPYSLALHENYSFSGELLKKGTKLVEVGDMFDPGRVALLAGEGITQVKVFNSPTVGIVSTGTELVMGGKELEFGQIYDSNRLLISSLVYKYGCKVVESIVEEDNPDAIAKHIARMHEKYDLVLTTGGVSVGDHDYLPIASEKAGFEKIFHGVNVKPGTPALAIQKDNKVAICLSGNPFAAYITFNLLVIPLLRRLSGYKDPYFKKAPCYLVEDFSRKSDIRRFIPGRLVGSNVYFASKNVTSRSASSHVDVNCIVDIAPLNNTLKAGQKVEAFLL